MKYVPCGSYFVIPKIVETASGMVLLGRAMCWVSRYHA